MKLIKTRFDKTYSTAYYNIEGISNWDLENLYLLLLAEQKRAEIVKGWNRGSEKLLKLLKDNLKKFVWGSGEVIKDE